MTFNRLQELIVEDDETGITSGIGAIGSAFSKGMKSSAGRHKESADKEKARLSKIQDERKEAENERKQAERDAQKKQSEAEKAAVQAVKAEKKIKPKVEKEAKKSASAIAAEHKLKTAEAMQELRDDIDEFLKNFFDRFPFHGGAGGSEDIIDKFRTKEAADEAIKIYTGLASRIDSLTVGFNKALLDQGKVSADQVLRYKQQAARMVNSDAGPAIPPALIKFVRSESKFFRRLIRVDNKFQLDAGDFKELLGLKIKQTDGARVPDAAQALTLLFTYMSEEFRGHARVISQAAVALDDESTAARKAARLSAAATSAAEDEADAKASEPNVPAGQSQTAARKVENVEFNHLRALLS